MDATNSRGLNRRRLLQSGAGAAAAGFAAPWVRAQSAWPNKPVTIVVPFPAGGALDNVARSIAEQMRTDLGQAVIVDNRAGAGGTLGSALVARAAPDGYTMLLGSVATHAIASGLYPKLTYDPIGDFAPITQLTSSPLVLTAAPQFTATNVAGLVAAAKARPGSINYASTGNGTALHLAGEVFRTAAVVERLNASARKALASPDVRKQLALQGDSPIGSSVEDFASFVRAEHKHWVAFVQAAGIKLE